MKRTLVTLLLVAMTALFVVPFAVADPCAFQDGSPKDKNQCLNAPEAPSTLLFPLAAVLVVGGYVILTRRRSLADH